MVIEGIINILMKRIKLELIDNHSNRLQKFARTLLCFGIKEGESNQEFQTFNQQFNRIEFRILSLVTRMREGVIMINGTKAI